MLLICQLRWQQSKNIDIIYQIDIRVICREVQALEQVCFRLILLILVHQLYVLLNHLKIVFPSSSLE